MMRMASRSSTHAGSIQVPERLVDPMTTTRAQRADALERWADDVDADDLVEARTAALRTIAELVEKRDDVDTALLDATAMLAMLIVPGRKSERCSACPVQAGRAAQVRRQDLGVITGRGGRIGRTRRSPDSIDRPLGYRRSVVATIGWRLSHNAAGFGPVERHRDTCRTGARVSPGQFISSTGRSAGTLLIGIVHSR